MLTVFFYQDNLHFQTICEMPELLNLNTSLSLFTVSKIRLKSRKTAPTFLFWTSHIFLLNKILCTANSQLYPALKPNWFSLWEYYHYLLNQIAACTQFSVVIFYSQNRIYWSQVNEIPCIFVYFENPLITRIQWTIALWIVIKKYETIIFKEIISS